MSKILDSSESDITHSTIKEKIIDNYPVPVSLESTEIIVNQMKENICRIYMNNGSKGTGFFCKIPFPDKLNLLPVLITNNHIIDKNNLENDKQISLTLNNDKIKLKIEINDGRKLFTSKKFDTTFIEILEKDGIKNFLELDIDIENEDFNDIYIKKSVYCLHYPKDQNISVSYGIIDNIDLSKKYDIFHLCLTEKGSSGSPLLNLLNNKVIAIHKGTKGNMQMNKGTLLSYPIKKFIRKYQEDKESEKYTLVNFSEMTFSRIRYKFYQQNRLLGKELYEKKGFQIYNVLDNIIFGALEGPPDSLYKKGFFMFVLNLDVDLNLLENRFLEEKPLNINPFLIFRTKIFHPNIEEKDNIMHPGIFKVKSWKSVHKIIKYIQSVLVEPNKNYFFEKEAAAKLYQKDKNEYEKKVKESVSKYATYSILQKSIKDLDSNDETMRYYLEFNNLFN